MGWARAALQTKSRDHGLELKSPVVAPGYNVGQIASGMVGAKQAISPQ